MLKARGCRTPAEIVRKRPRLSLTSREAATTASSINSSMGVGRCLCLCMLPTAVCSSCVHYPPNAHKIWCDGRLTGWRRVSGVYGRSC
jgi:hypothetical protein